MKIINLRTFTLDMKIHLLGFLFGVICIAAGILFHSFWRSEWGFPTFVLLVWLCMSLVLGWGGKGKPYSLLFGIIAGSTFVPTFLITAYIDPYVGLGVWLVVVYFGMKTNFFARRMDQLKQSGNE